MFILITIYIRIYILIYGYIYTYMYICMYVLIFIHTLLTKYNELSAPKSMQSLFSIYIFHPESLDGYPSERK